MAKTPEEEVGMKAYDDAHRFVLQLVTKTGMVDALAEFAMQYAAATRVEPQSVANLTIGIFVSRMLAGVLVKMDEAEREQWLDALAEETSAVLKAVNAVPTDIFDSTIGKLFSKFRKEDDSGTKN